MYELGKKNQVFGADKLKLLKAGVDFRTSNGLPISMPILKEGENVVGGYDQGLGERLIVCEDLADMQQLYRGYQRGGALNLNWYTAFDAGFIIALSQTT